MPRLLLSDEHWSKLREILLYKTIYNKRDLRMAAEGMLHRMRTRCHWRELPKAFGNWILKSRAAKSMAVLRRLC
jgi:transposase